MWAVVSWSKVSQVERRPYKNTLSIWTKNEHFRDTDKTWWWWKLTKMFWGLVPQWHDWNPVFHSIESELTLWQLLLLLYIWAWAMDMHHVYSGEAAAVHQIGEGQAWSEQISSDSIWESVPRRSSLTSCPWVFHKKENYRICPEWPKNDPKITPNGPKISTS